jgi:CRISPR type III-B/RAMP module RAMP protein Cmr6
MTLPLYLDHQAPRTLPEHGHRGLWYERFFDRYAPAQDWTVPDEGKLQWIQQTAARPAGDANALDQAAQRQLALVTALGGRGAVFKADWHLATGLGLPHPVENGFAWHPTLGVPYLAGSAVKGLVRAWVEIWDETLDAHQRKRRLDTWFGFADQPVDAHDGSPPRNASQAGAFHFFDALPIKPVGLRADVMTPHQGKWYEQGGAIEDWRREPEKVPADWHAPVPVPFLVANKPQLLFAIAPRQAAAAGELAAVFNALKDALAWLGAGAKTAVGYGLMQASAKQTEALHIELAKAQQQAALTT